MSTHFKTTVSIIAALSILLAICWVRLMKTVEGMRPAMSRPSTILKANDREAVSYNSNSHILTVATSSGTKTEYTRNPVIHFQKDGTIKIDRKVFGLELNPFFGLGYGDRLRVHGGVGFLYAWRFDLNVQLAAAFDKTASPAIVPVVSVSYNFWRDTSLFVGASPNQSYHTGLLVRF